VGLGPPFPNALKIQKNKAQGEALGNLLAYREMDDVFRI